MMRPSAQLVPAVQVQDQHPLPIGLTQIADMGPHQVLAQQHAEHGRLRRVFKAGLCKMHARVAGTGGNQQPQILPLRTKR